MKIVKYIGGRTASFNSIWGGTVATTTLFLKCFEGDSDFKIIPLFKGDIFQKPFIEDEIIKKIKDFSMGADIFHVDDTLILDFLFQNNFESPDIIGPISRSPLKKYTDGNSVYNMEWFYKARIIRLNYAEEQNNKNLVNIISHGVDTDFLLPDWESPKRYILWAGDKKDLLKIMK